MGKVCRRDEITPLHMCWALFFGVVRVLKWLFTFTFFIFTMIVRPACNGIFVFGSVFVICLTPIVIGAHFEHRASGIIGEKYVGKTVSGK